MAQVSPDAKRLVWIRRVRLLVAAMLFSAIALMVFFAVRKFPSTANRDQASGDSGELSPADENDKGLASGDSKDESDAPQQPGFRAVTTESGIHFKMNFLAGEQGQNFKINLYDHGCGVAVGDANGDGHDDIYFCNQLGSNALYRNDGQGKFRDVTKESGPIGLGDRVCVGATFSDYDNDGDQDLFVTSTRGGNSLFRNDGRGVFQNVTDEAGVQLVAHSQNGTFFDFDLDGDLDLFVTNTAAWTTAEFNRDEHYYHGLASLTELAGSPVEQNVCYRNNGDGTFTDVTAAVGLTGQGWSGDIAALDFDEDGRPDLFVTNMFGKSQLYRNQPNGTFVDVTCEALGPTSWGAIGALAADFTNDGRLDLYVVDMHSDMWVSFKSSPQLVDEKRKYKFLGGGLVQGSLTNRAYESEMADLFQIDYAAAVFGNTLFKNLGAGKFEEVSDNAGVETFWPWGLAAGDFDNDGFQDIFVPSGMGYPYFYWRNYLLMNNGNATFSDRTRACGIEPRPGGEFQDERIARELAARSSRCAATADFDGDGRLDLIVQNFNEAPYLYRNEFPPQNYVQFRLQGVKSNRDAIGATLRLYCGDEMLMRQVNAAMGYLSHSSKTLHVGLGARDKIDRAEIRWPNGTLQVVESPAINQTHAIVEPMDDSRS